MKMAFSPEQDHDLDMMPSGRRRSEAAEAGAGPCHRNFTGSLDASRAALPYVPCGGPVSGRTIIHTDGYGAADGPGLPFRQNLILPLWKWTSTLPFPSMCSCHHLTSVFANVRSSPVTLFLLTSDMAFPTQSFTLEYGGLQKKSTGQCWPRPSFSGSYVQAALCHGVVLCAHVHGGHHAEPLAGPLVQVWRGGPLVVLADDAHVLNGLWLAHVQ